MCANLMEITSSSPHNQLRENFSHSLPLAMNNGIWGKVNNLTLLNPKPLQVFEPAIILASSWSFLMQHDKEHWVSLVGILKCPEPNPSRKIHATLPVLSMVCSDHGLF